MESSTPTATVSPPTGDDLCALVTVEQASAVLGRAARPGTPSLVEGFATCAFLTDQDRLFLSSMTRETFASTLALAEQADVFHPVAAIDGASFSSSHGVLVERAGLRLQVLVTTTGELVADEDASVAITTQVLEGLVG